MVVDFLSLRQPSEANTPAMDGAKPQQPGGEAPLTQPMEQRQVTQGVQGWSREVVTRQDLTDEDWREMWRNAIRSMDANHAILVSESVARDLRAPVVANESRSGFNLSGDVADGIAVMFAALNQGDRIEFEE